MPEIVFTEHGLLVQSHITGSYCF